MSTAVAAGTGVRDLSALFDPRSVAVVGASDDPAKWGHHLARAAASRAGRPRRAPGQPARRHGAGASGPDAAAGRRRPRRPGRDLRAGSRLPRRGRRRARLGRPRDRRHHGRPVGGLAGGARDRARGAAPDPRGRRGAGRPQLPRRHRHHLVAVPRVRAVHRRPGRGAARRAATSSSTSTTSWPDRGLGISRFVSLGNQADVSLAELMRACADHDGTRAVAVYAEDVHDGRAFVAAARALAVGREARGAARTGPLRRSLARCRVAHRLADQPGTRRRRRVHGRRRAPRRDAARAGRRARRPRRPAAVPRGRRTAVLTDGGGHGAIASRRGRRPSGSRCRSSRPSSASVLTHALVGAVDGVEPGRPRRSGRAGPEQLCARRRDAARTPTRSTPSCWWATSAATRTTRRAWPTPRCRRRTRSSPRSARRASRCVVHSIFPESPSVQVLADGGHPGAPRLRRGGRGSLAALCVSPRAAAADPLELPPPAAPLTEHGLRRDARAARRLRRRRSLRCRVVRDEPALRGRARRRDELRFPVVLKAMGLLHKSDAGGVVLGLRDAASVRRGVPRPRRPARPARRHGRGDGRPRLPASR